MQAPGLDNLIRKKGARPMYPYTLGELITAKILALLHDPPWKSITITGKAVGKERVSDVLRDCEPWCLNAFLHFGYGGHEGETSILATYIVGRLLVSLDELLGDSSIMNLLFSRLANTLPRSVLMVKKADWVASAFDRIAIANAELLFKDYLQRKALLNVARKIGLCYRRGGIEKCPISTAVVSGLANPFDPSVNHAVPYAPGNVVDVLSGLSRFKKRYEELLEAFMCLFPRGGRSYIDEVINYLSVAYHVFSVVYEPLWHMVTQGKTWGPADTRVPHHSIFDHLYASASALNLVVSHKGVGGINGGRHDVGVTGFFVYVGWRGLGEWLRSSRKLSDLWVSSWLATAMTWYAVKELVWCLGPDVLVLPGFRWNQFYLSLLQERLGEDLFEHTVDRVARDFYFWDGFPYYAWQPAEAILVLPLLNPDSVLPTGCEHFRQLLKDIESVVGGASQGDDITRVGPGEAVNRLQKIAKIIQNHLSLRLRDAWSRVVEAVAEAVEKAASNESGSVFGPELANFVKQVSELVKDVPPMEPVVEVVPIWAGVRRAGSGGKELCFHVGGDTGREVCKRLEELGDPENVKELLGVESDTLAALIANQLGGSPSSAGLAAWLFAKIVYALGFYELMRRVEAGRSSVSLPSWARLVVKPEKLRKLEEQSSKLLGARREHVWRSCTVCRHGVSVLWVPGRDTPEGVTEEYKEFALRLCGGGDRDRCWRIWRPVLRPGERLCPYCLVKRLAGLPEVFRRVAESLVGYPPAKEVRFPATDDVAALATKLALLRLLRLIAGHGGDGVDKVAGEALSDVRGEVLSELISLGRDVARLPHRSRLHEELAEALRGGAAPDQLREKLERLIEGRWWVPRLLYRELAASYQAVEGAGDEEALTALAGAALLIDYEFYDLLFGDYGWRILGKLRGIAGLVRSAARRLRGRESAGARRLLLDIAEALASPRTYYSILRFDVDGMGALRQGLMRRGDSTVSAEEYLEKLVRSHEEVLQQLFRRRVRADKIYKACLGTRFLRDYLGPCGEGWSSDPLLALAREAGTLLVTPSYHQALSNALGYTLLRSAIVAERLGGIPVYMGGDEGLIVLPAWLPWSLLPRRSSEGYRGEVVRAAGCGSSCPVAENPGLVAAILLRRIYWASSSAKPGFHPVKKRGAGKTLYRIPALVSTGLSIGLRFSHYRDHLYAEIAAAEHLLEAAKMLGGDRLAASMGRVQPAKPREALETMAPARLGAVEVNDAARIVAEAAVLAGMIEEGLVSKGLLRAPMLQLREGPAGLQLVTEEFGAGKVAWSLIESYMAASRAATRLKKDARRVMADILEQEGVEVLLNLIGAVIAASEKSTGR